MRLHLSPSDFRDAMEAAAQHLRMRPIVVEKDYWVTFVLKNLSQSEYKSMVVFKGGTSLSKAFNSIDRFSEDIDLALLPQSGITGNATKNLLKKVSNEITGGLQYIPGHPSESKYGQIRATAYAYPRILSETEMESFSVQVLSQERTFFEKLLSLNRLSYNGMDALQEKVRHFYDIYQLYHQPGLRPTILSPQFFSMVSNVLKDDLANSTMAGAWVGRPLLSSPLFSDLEAIWSKLAPVYTRSLTELVQSDSIPSEADILEVLKAVRTFMARFDETWDDEK